MVTISQARLSRSKVSVQGKVVKMYNLERIGYGKTRLTGYLEDDSGKIKFALYDQQTELIDVGKKLLFNNSYIRDFRGEPTISTGFYGGTVQLLPDKFLKSFGGTNKEFFIQKREKKLCSMCDFTFKGELCPHCGSKNFIIE